jgi:multiple sugar transport system permease protein
MVSSIRAGVAGYLRQEQARYGTLFVLPTFLFFCVFIVWPIFCSFYLGFFDWSPLEPQPRPVGLANYQELFATPSFLRAIVNTLVFTLGVLSLTVAGSLALALALNQGLRGKALFRSIYYSPVVTSLVATAMIWLWILDPQFGVVNQALRAAGLPAPGWAADSVWAMPTVIVTFSWREVGYFTVIYLAGLQGIPEHIYEAAAIDGADRWAQFWGITLPLLSPTTFFVIVVWFIGALQMFIQVEVLTQGGPLDATITVVYLVYTTAFQNLRMGYAAAMSFLLFIFIGLVTYLNTRVLRNDVAY